MNRSNKDRFKDLADEVGDLFSKDVDEDYRELQMQFLQDMKASSEAIIQDAVRRQDHLLEELTEQLSEGEIEKPDLHPGATHLEEEYEKLSKEKSDTDARLRRILLEKEAADAERQALETQAAASENALVLYKEDAEKDTDQLRQKVKSLEEQLDSAVLLADERGVEKEQAEERLTRIEREKEGLDASRQTLEEKVIESEKALNIAKENSERTADQLQQENVHLENQLSKAVMLADEQRQEKEQAEVRLAQITSEKEALEAGWQSPKEQDEGSEDPEESIDELHQRIIDLENRLNNAILLADERLVDKEQAEEKLILATRENEGLESAGRSQDVKIVEVENASAAFSKNAERTEDKFRRRIIDLEGQLNSATMLADERLLEKEQAEERLTMIDRKEKDLDAIKQSLEEKVIESEKALNDAVQLAAQRLGEKEQTEDRLIQANRELEALTSAGSSREEQIAESENVLAGFKETAKRTADELRQKISALEDQLDRGKQLAGQRLREKEQAEERLAVMAREKEALVAAGPSPNASDMPGEDAEKISDEFREKIANLEKQLSNAVQLAAQRLLEKEQAEDRLTLTNREKEALASAGPSREEQIRESEIAFNRFKEGAKKISDDLRVKIYNLEEQLSSAILLADKRLAEKDMADEQLIRITGEKDALHTAGQLRTVPAVGSGNAIKAFVDDVGSIPDEFRQGIIDLKDRQRDAVMLADKRRLQEEQTGEGLNLITRERRELEGIKSALEQQKEESKKLLIDLLKMQRRFKISAGGNT